MGLEPDFYERDTEPPPPEPATSEHPTWPVGPWPDDYAVDPVSIPRDAS